MTQIHEPPELDCSPGAKMLIERMQTNPDEFEPSRGKFGRVLEGAYSERDKKAITKAHDTYIKEPRLMVSVLEALTTPEPKEEEATLKIKSQGRYATTAIPNPYGTALIKGEGQAISASWNDPTTYSTVVNNQRISHEMEMRMHIAEHEYHAKRQIEEQRRRQLSWPDNLKGML